MNKDNLAGWLIIGVVVGALATLAISASWWLPILLGFIGTNSDLIQGLSDLVQLVLWAITALAALVGIRRMPRRAPGERSESSGNDISPPVSITMIGQGNAIGSNNISIVVDTNTQATEQSSSQPNAPPAPQSAVSQIHGTSQ